MQGSRMRMAELSATSGVSIPSIKFYQREGLLPLGEHTSPNQAWYDESHVHRLTLIRALRDVGQLPLASIKAVVDVLQDPSADSLQAMGTVHRAITDVPDVEQAGEYWDQAAEILDTVIEQRKWPALSADNPSRVLVIASVARLLVIGADPAVATRVLGAYAVSAEASARADLAEFDPSMGIDELITLMVAWETLGDRAHSGLRGLAQEMVARELLGQPVGDGESSTEPDSRPTQRH